MSRTHQPHSNKGQAVAQSATPPTHQDASSVATSNAAAQDQLGLASTPSANGPTCEPTDDDAYGRFLEEEFQALNNAPSTGMGLFDAAYSPKTGTLDLTLRLAFHFKGPHDEGWFGPSEPPWTEDEKAAWINEFVDAVEGTWNAGHVIRCVKPGWCVEAMPVLHVMHSDDAPHYTVDVHKSAGHGSDFRPHVHEGGWFGDRTATFEEDHTHRGIDDSGVVDHAIETVEGATRDEPFRFRMSSEAPEFEPGEEKRLADLKAALATMPASGPKLQTYANGWSHDDPASDRAAQQVAESLHGAPHSCWAAGGDNANGEVRLSVNHHPQSITYDDAFTFAAHEVGHMLGNADEYEGAPDEGLEAGQQALIDASGADDVIRDADTASVMSKGGEVLPAHLATAWEALTRMTSAYLSPSEWQFE